MKTLFDAVRTEQNMFAAWRHVKKSALNSGNSDIRGLASEFEHKHQTYLKRFIDQLREGRFTFDPVQGVLKDKRKRIAKGKDPRPIAIAPIKNRVVQRAILQVLQPREARDLRDVDTRYESRRDPRLGKINDVNRSRFGVGGLIYPYGGVGPAIRTVTDAIDCGARYYYQSDIKAFFTQIPTAVVVNFVQHETGDPDLSRLFEEALRTELSNKDELKGYANLFPKGGIGVAQGSSLSAFAGNVLLYDLDHELNGLGVTAVRYIDDILMVSSDADSLDAAIQVAKTRLNDFGFGLYEPSEGSDKASRGECCNAINFLGCTIQPRRCVPSKASIDKMKEGVRDALSSSKAAIKQAVQGKRKLDPAKSQSATLSVLGKRIYGWQKSFGFCNDIQPFRHLDDYIADQVVDYQGFIMRTLRGADQHMQMTVSGIPSTEDMFHASRSGKR